MVDVKPLENRTAAEVTGVDVRRINGDFDTVHTALLDHGVIALRSQDFSPDEQVSFSRRWGEVECRPLGSRPTARSADAQNLPPEVVAIEYEPGKSIPTDEWHCDATYLPAPPAITMATLRVQPEAGGDTMFASLSAAYDDLSSQLKEFLEPLWAIHELPPNEGPQTGPRPGPFRHPVVTTHPESGKKILYINKKHTTRIEGLTPGESRMVLDYLFQHQTRPEYVYRHRWQPGDFVIWDNRAVLHYAVQDYGDTRRVLHRTTVLGREPSQ
jgi:taurine dioxygenase